MLCGFFPEISGPNGVTGTGEPEAEVSKELHIFIQGFEGKAQGYTIRRHGLMVWWFLRFLSSKKIPESCESSRSWLVRWDRR